MSDNRRCHGDGLYRRGADHRGGRCRAKGAIVTLEHPPSEFEAHIKKAIDEEIARQNAHTIPIGTIENIDTLTLTRVVISAGASFDWGTSL